MIRPGLLLDVADLDGLDAVLLDTRLTTTGPPGREQYDAGHLPGAVYVDLDDDLAGAPGPGGYDAGPATAAARLWWLLRDHGHADVLVLDGGLAAWVAAGRPVSTEPSRPPLPGDWTGVPGHLTAVDDTDAAALPTRGVLLDVRAAERFRGDTEPIDAVAGHVPGAVNAPLTGNTDDLGRFLSPEPLRSRFASLGVRADVPVAAYCGSGVTACQTILALRLVELDAALYPGSWSGWISDPTRPVATGA